MALRELLRNANYDDALALVRSSNTSALVNAADETDRLRQQCMVADVLDYGGSYDRAKQTIQDAGKRAKESLLKEGRTPADLFEPAYMKQQCWALMEWGMSLYRHATEGYTEAEGCFGLAQKVLLMLDESKALPCTGSLARSWYCLGLVHRQRKNYHLARAAFGSCVRLAGIGVEQRKERNQSTAGYDFNLARCYGLGIGYIAYDEALLSEAKSALVIARRLLMDINARFIRAYVDVIHAAAVMSGSMDLDSVEQGITELKIAYDILAPPGGAVGHAAYALRATNELSQAYLRRARAVSPDEQETNLCVAEDHLRKVGWPFDPATTKAIEPRTKANALIIESRILRARGKHQAARDEARKAKGSAGALTFSRIDACITIGEAAYDLGEYRESIEAFEEALVLGRNSHRITAVCHLHLSRTYLKDGKPSKAADHFSKWKVLEPDIENAFITALSNRVHEMLRPEGDFHISHAVLDLNAKTHVYELHHWLAVNAMRRAGDDYLLAGALLGVAKETVRLWLGQG